MYFLYYYLYHHWVRKLTNLKKYETAYIGKYYIYIKCKYSRNKGKTATLKAQWMLYTVSPVSIEGVLSIVLLN